MKTDAVNKFPSQFSCSKIKFVDNSQDPKSALFSFTLPVAAMFAMHAFGVLLGKIVHQVKKFVPMSLGNFPLRLRDFITSTYFCGFLFFAQKKINLTTC